ncbi:MAG TPA: molybdenum cofactor biosynthesis protein B [Planctomycetota bacterium]|nr:molybdenum cofactor biosynthesis protein B [Planctomycetota bacterium]
MTVKDHSEGAARDIGAARCHVLTVSDTRRPETDESGRIAAEILEAAGHKVEKRRIVPNDASKIILAVKASVIEGADLVLALGGTGVSRRDVTVEAVRSLIQKELPGFGELFRALSVKEIGTAAILSRATLGATAERSIVAATPGSPAAVRLALNEILVPQLKHLLREVRKDP